MILPLLQGCTIPKIIVTAHRKDWENIRKKLEATVADYPSAKLQYKDWGQTKGADNAISSQENVPEEVFEAFKTAFFAPEPIE